MMTISDRCVRAADAVAAYSDDDPVTNLVDFLADAMHWCQAEGHDFAAMLGTAEMHFEAETVEEAGIKPLNERPDSRELQPPTPRPWAVWKLATDSDPQQRNIIVTADGEDEITSIVHREADARLIVHCVNLFNDLTASLAECARLLADYDTHEGEEGAAYRQAVRILTTPLA